MSRPNVFPVGSEPKPNLKPQPDQDNLPPVRTDAEYEANKLEVATEIYSHSADEHAGAIEAMMLRTQQQIIARNAQLAKNKEATQQYHESVQNIEKQKVPTAKPAPVTHEAYAPVEEKPRKVFNLSPTPQAPVKTQQDDAIQRISQPQFNAPYDVIPLPSLGKLYKGVKSSVKVAYMTAADENILTSPNLLASGQFLEILINRKLLESNLRYHDLHIGDRNAIMLWLRATSYGEMYPVTLLDENDVPFDTQINLNDLKTKKLEATPDSNGYFTFQFPISQKTLTFRFLNIRDNEEIEAMHAVDQANEELINNVPTYTLMRQIVAIDGITDSNYIQEFLEFARVGDIEAFREYYDKIESGVDLMLTVGTPGGGSINTFLPLNLKFFWPKLSI